MHGLSTTLIVIVTAVVILIVALVLLTIFSTVIFPYATLAEAKNACRISAQNTCATMNTLPVNWQFPMRAGDEWTSCAMLFGCADSPSCSSCGI